MKRVLATFARRNLGRVLADVKGGPVMIYRRGQQAAVLVSIEEYDRLRGAATAELERLCAIVGSRAASRGLTEEILADALSSGDEPTA